VNPEPSSDLSTWPKVNLTPRWSGLDQPIAIAHAGDGTGRLFVCEKAGRVRVIEHGELRDEPFLEITDRVSVRHLEQGLLSVAFPPSFPERRWIYACYTDVDNDVIVSRFEVDDSGSVALADTEEHVLDLWHPYRNHNGGQIQIGPDGYLYVGIGDGGSEYDPNNYGQNPGVGLAKILRIDPESVGGDHEDGSACECPYHIPEDNPFYLNDYFAPETWHWGLRNPWRFSFDRDTGDMYIGEVGQDDWEEIDFASAGVGGLNFGWSLWEGAHYHPADGARSRHKIASLGEQDLVFPIAEYDHHEDGGTAVVGGYVYCGARFEQMRGVYFYADYGNGRIFGLRRDADGRWEGALLAETRMPVTSFGEDEEGELYIASLKGEIHSIGQ